MTARVVPVSGLAILIGLVAAYVAAVLLKLIGFFTNLFFFQRIDTALVSPVGHHLGPFVIVPEIQKDNSDAPSPAVHNRVSEHDNVLPLRPLSSFPPENAPLSSPPAG